METESSFIDNVTNNRSDNKMVFFEFCFVATMVMYYIFPTLRKLVPFFSVLVVQSVYLIILTIIENKGVSSRIWKYVFLIFLIGLCYGFLTESSAISDVSNRIIKTVISKFSQYFFFFFPLCLMWRVKKQANKKQLAVLLLFSLLLLLYVSYETIQQIKINPLVARRSDFSSFEESRDLDIIVGGFTFVYGVTFLVVTIILILPFLKLKWEKIVSILLASYFFYFLIQAQFSIAMISTVIASIFALLLQKNKSAGTLVIYVILAVFLLLIITPLILELAIRNTNSSLLQERFGEVLTAVTTGKVSSDGDMYGRFELYWMSIKAFFSSPIWGNRIVNFDGHATFLVTLAHVGLMGGIPLYILLKDSYYNAKRLLGNNGLCFKPIFFLLLMMGFTNPIHAALPVAMSVWFFAPITIFYFAEIRK
ncbi:MAG: hypothetical protein MJZ20_06665 [Bacteroidaceae bacterium]|nr:hypothetical protein [Bacteroidaceae bacterium]